MLKTFEGEVLGWVKIHILAAKIIATTVQHIYDYMTEKVLKRLNLYLYFNMCALQVDLHTVHTVYMNNT